MNGIPGHANSHYINDILKGELKFEGFVVSDWEDVNRLYVRDKVVESAEDAVKLAVMSGIDMSMVPYDFSFTDYCVKISQRDGPFLDRVNDAVLRILKVKEKLGLWSNASLYPVESEAKKVGNDEFHRINLETAHESIILAKNDANLLPLKKSDSKKILVTGPTGNLLKVLNGGWTYTWQGDDEANYQNFGRLKFTIFGAIQKALAGQSSTVIYSEGVNFENKTNFEETIEAAQVSDLIILTIGEDTYTESPGNINNLFLHAVQNELANALFALNKSVILVYLGGRPRIITEMAQKANAVLFGFLPGNRGGEAIADIIFGDYNPDGKLPITYPLSPNGFVTYDRKPLEDYETSDPLALSRGEYENLYPFGHGLSYSKFIYSSLTLSSTQVELPNGVTVSLEVTNYGPWDGKETVILYLNDEFGSVSRPVREVKGFQKVFLKVNETKSVRFDLKHADFSFISQKNQRIVESGVFHVYIQNFDGNATFYLKETTPYISTSSKTYAGCNSFVFVLLMILSSLFIFV